MDPKQPPYPPAGFAPPPHDPMYGQGPAPPPYTTAPMPPTYAPPPGAVQSPPMPGQMPMPYPGPAPAAPPPVGVNTVQGPLGYLSAIDQLLIKQEIHLLEVAVNVQTNMKFDILNNQGQLVYRAEEQSEYCSRECGGSNRGFTIYIKDLMGSDIIALRRDCKCCGCCFPCWCLQEMVVEAPPGYPIGKVKEDWTFCSPSFTIVDERESPIYKISTGCCPGGSNVNMGSDVHFKVVDIASSHQIGTITKEWSGVMQEMFTRATNFNVSFPMHLAVQHKAILLSVSFLLNFMYFQHTPTQFRNREDNSGPGVYMSSGSDHHHTTCDTDFGTTTTFDYGGDCGTTTTTFDNDNYGTTTTTFD